MQDSEAELVELPDGDITELIARTNIGEGQDLAKVYKSTGPLSMADGPGEYVIARVDHDAE